MRSFSYAWKQTTKSIAFSFLGNKQNTGEAEGLQVGIWRSVMWAIGAGFQPFPTCARQNVEVVILQDHPIFDAKPTAIHECAQFFFIFLFFLAVGASIYGDKSFKQCNTLEY